MSASYNARAAATCNGDLAEGAQEELNEIRHERDQLLSFQNSDEETRSVRFVKIAENLGRMAKLTEEAQNEVSKLPEPSLIGTKATVTMQLDDTMNRARSVNDYVTHGRSTILEVPQPARELSPAMRGRTGVTTGRIGTSTS